MKEIVGIDLGTTNSVIAYVDMGRPRVIPADGERIFPSVVGVSEEGKLLVGRPARNQYIIRPESTVKSVKRLMGSEQRVIMAGKEYTPSQISAMILGRLRDIAQAHLGDRPQKAVITVPAYFADAARQETREAGELAGLDVVRIINEPTASALAYGLNREDEQRVLVYDLGGGTFDVSIVEIASGVIEVIATSGDNHLGGDDFDQRIVDYVAGEFLKEHGVDLRRDARALARLIRAAEAAKIELSDHPFAAIREEFIAAKDGKPLNLGIEVSRAKFEELIGDLLDRTTRLLDKTLADASMKPSDIDRILLVGGSTRIPAVSEILEARMGKEPSSEVNPDECVALGAAVQAAIIAGEEVDAVLVDVTAFSLGISAIGEVGGMVVPNAYSTIIKRNTVIPTSKAEVYTTVRDNQDEVEIEVYQGENPIASGNAFLGKFMLKGIKPAPAGEPKIIVKFEYDLDGMVQVSAVEKETGKEQRMTISNVRDKVPEKAENTAILAVIDKARSIAGGVEDEEERAALLSLADDIEAALDQDDMDAVAELEAELIDALYEFEEE